MAFLWLVALIPVVIGGLVWGVGRLVNPTRGVLGAVAVATIGAVASLGAWARATEPAASFGWGAGVGLQLDVTPVVGAMALIVALIALPVALWATAHEPRDGLERLIGLMLVFVGAMELLVLAADLLTVAIGWELVGALSWALIGHDLDDPDAAGDAAFAFNTTRLGGLGLFVAAGAAMAVTGSFAFSDLPRVAASPWGDVLAAGVLVAAASKSAQLPFSPWLFRAMAGPPAVSALLHSSTMVAAGAWLVIRLHEPLSQVDWFGPAVIAIGLTTAIAGGVVAAAQSRAKRLLAASTSAHYGFMFAAVGAGASGAALAHLGTHAAFKSLLFLVAGIAIGAAGSHKLFQMRLGRLLPWTALASAVGALALAGIFPLGGAFSKEKVIAGLGQESTLLAVAAIAAGGLSAWYAGRFHVLAFGRPNTVEDDPRATHASPIAGVAMAWLALITVASSLLWAPGVSEPVAAAVGITWPHGTLWETIAAAAVAVVAALSAWFVYRPAHEVPADQSRLHRRVAGWLGLPGAIDALIAHPTRVIAAGCARFDDRVVAAGARGAARLVGSLSTVADRGLETLVDAAVRGLVATGQLAADTSRAVDESAIDRFAEGVARGIGEAADPARHTQSGQLARYYVYVTVGLATLILLAAVGS